jgi:hypothetical protein
MRYAFVFTACFVFSGVMAQGYPSKPIRLVLPFGVGGLVDVPGRIISAKLGDAMGQPIIVENRAGAGGTI